LFGKKKKIVFRIFIANFKTTTMKHKKFRGMHHGVSGFRAQSGFNGGATNYYAAGEQMAIAVFNEGGVNALLAFLAGYNSAG
tara:strand:+ start:350 stop:595 length:246 start_codon:yes stop_codon:yes gene_type:complete